MARYWVVAEHIGPAFIGSDLAPADYAALDARWIDRQLASRACLRRADSLTGATLSAARAATTPGSLSLISAPAPTMFANIVCAATIRISNTTPSAI